MISVYRRGFKFNGKATAATHPRPQPVDIHSSLVSIKADGNRIPRELEHLVELMTLFGYGSRSTSRSHLRLGIKLETPSV